MPDVGTTDAFVADADSVRGEARAQRWTCAVPLYGGAVSSGASVRIVWVRASGPFSASKRARIALVIRQIAPQSCRICATCCGLSSGLIGTKTQPAAAIPSSETTVSMRLSRKMPIRAPGAIPSEVIAWPSACALGKFLVAQADIAEDDRVRIGCLMCGCLHEVKYVSHGVEWSRRVEEDARWTSMTNHQGAEAARQTARKEQRPFSDLLVATGLEIDERICTECVADRAEICGE